MSKKADGGPVFPMNPMIHWWDGMTLRDYFAAKALSGWLASYGSDTKFPEAVEVVAEQCYAMADAMIAEKNKTQ